MNRIETEDSLKMVRETLCAAQTALSSEDPTDWQSRRHRDVLQRLINDIDRQRPLGPDGVAMSPPESEAYNRTFAPVHAVSVVSPGDVVAKGDVIATFGRQEAVDPTPAKIEPISEPTFDEVIVPPEEEWPPPPETPAPEAFDPPLTRRQLRELEETRADWSFQPPEPEHPKEDFGAHRHRSQERSLWERFLKWGGF